MRAMDKNLNTVIGRAKVIDRQMEEYENVVKNEVQRAISADEEAIARLCHNYLDNVRAFIQHEKIRSEFTGELEEPDERLMRSIEEKIPDEYGAIAPRLPGWTGATSLRRTLAKARRRGQDELRHQARYGAEEVRKAKIYVHFWLFLAILSGPTCT